MIRRVPRAARWLPALPAVRTGAEPAAQSKSDGAVRSSEILAPGVQTDWFSAFRELGLDAYGLQWRHAPAVVAHPLRSPLHLQAAAAKPVGGAIGGGVQGAAGAIAARMALAGHARRWVLPAIARVARTPQGTRR